MAVREDEAVTVGPVGRRRVVLHDPRVHSTWASGASAIAVPGWPEFRLLHRVHREAADHVDAWRSTRLGRRRSGHCIGRRTVTPVRATGAVAPSCRVVRGHPTASSDRNLRWNRARLAVNPCRKLRPPTGPISPAQNAPAIGSGPSSRSTTPASWSGVPKRCCPRPLHVNSSAPPASCAGEQRAAGLRRRRPRRGRGTARSGRRSRRRRSRARRSLVGAEHVADEEVAPPELDLVLVDDEADVQTVADQLAVFVARRGRAVLEPRQRGLTGELLDPVPLGAGHDEGTADGRQPCETTVSTSTPSISTPTAPVDRDAVAEDEPVPARSAGPPTPRRRSP